MQIFTNYFSVVAKRSIINGLTANISSSSAKFPEKLSGLGGSVDVSMYSFRDNLFNNGTLKSPVVSVTLFDSNVRGTGESIGKELVLANLTEPIELTIVHNEPVNTSIWINSCQYWDDV